MGFVRIVIKDSDDREERIREETKVVNQYIKAGVPAISYSANNLGSVWIPTISKISRYMHLITDEPDLKPKSREIRSAVTSFRRNGVTISGTSTQKEKHEHNTSSG